MNKTRQKKIIVAGGSGFIGRNLTKSLLQKGYRVEIFDLYPPGDESIAFYRIDLVKNIAPPEKLEGAHGVINLCGGNIFTRWTTRKKKEMYDSRVACTKSLVAGIAKLKIKPLVFISASAIGYYGDGGDHVLTEDSPQGTGFLAELCVAWEKEAQNVSKLGVRSLRVRTAPVLGRGGMLSILIPLFRLGFGGQLGIGNQWFSWIHVEDLASLYIHALEDTSLQGIINATSPEPVTNREFTKVLGKVLHRPIIFAYPGWFLQLLLGEVGGEVIKSVRVVSKKTAMVSFQFKYRMIADALKDTVQEKGALETD